MSHHAYGDQRTMQESILSLRHMGPGELNPDDQAWQQVPLPTKPSCWPLTIIFCLFLNSIFRQTCRVDSMVTETVSPQQMLTMCFRFLKAGLSFFFLPCSRVLW